MSDEHQIITITDKEAVVENIGTIVSGDTNSCLLTFEINRFQDGIDLSDKKIRFNYRNSNGKFYDHAVNVKYNDDVIRFSWLLPYSLTQPGGNVIASIEFYGSTEYDEHYSYKTKNFKLSVEKSLGVDDGSDESYNNWAIKIENDVEVIQKKISEIEKEIKSIHVPTKLSEMDDDAEHRTVSDSQIQAWNEAHKNSQADWNEENTNSSTYIKNKPQIPKVTNDLTDELKQSYDNAVTNSHVHNNKSVIDSITAEKVSNWDNKSEFDGQYSSLQGTPDSLPASDVYQWAKQPEKPSYTAEEVGAMPVGTKIPSKTSDLQNDSGFLTDHQDLSDYALKSEVPKSASDIGADASGTAESKVSEHNISDTAHNDIRLLLQGLIERLNALADSDDETLDQMSEVVAYIKSNKSLIDAITTSKVSVSDIIDNLTTNVSNKPLSAAQGVKLKELIDAIVVPDKLPNPQKLTFSGAVTAEYDGSRAVTVNIPEGSGGSGGIKDFESVIDFVIEEEVTNILIPLSDEVKNKIWNAHFIELMVHVIASSNEEDTNTGNLSVAFRSSNIDEPSEWMTNGWYNGFLVQEATNAVLDSITNWKKYAITWALIYADTSINMSNSIYIKTYAQNQDIIYNKFDYNRNVINEDFLKTVKALAVWSSAPNFGVGTRIILRVM